jgi:anti-sigma factor RsiW
MKPDRCRWVAVRLPLLAGSELMGLDRRRVERHVLGCAKCRDRLAAHTRALDALHAAGEPCSARGDGSLWPSLARQIHESRRTTSRSLARPIVVLRLGLAAAALVAAACTGIGLWTLHQKYQVVVRPRPPRAVVMAPASPPRDTIDSSSASSTVIPASAARQVDRESLAEDLSQGSGIDGRPAIVPTN